jgi:hypothetical protein
MIHLTSADGAAKALKVGVVGYGWGGLMNWHLYRDAWFQLR